MGNKTDLENKREVKSEEAALLAAENGYFFSESSCVKNENVADAFLTLIEHTNIEFNKKEEEDKPKMEIVELKNSEISSNKKYFC